MKKTVILAGLLALAKITNAQNTAPLNPGNVGIGTTLPNFALSVQSIENQTILGHNVSSVVRITNNYSAAFGRRSELQFGLDQNSNNTLSTIATEYTAWTAGRVGGDMLFATASDQSTSVIERMRINHFGNIGIGTTTPEDKLQVNNNSNKVVIGSAFGSGLNYGTSYIGFNASRDNSVLQQNSTWKTSTDGSNNGGGAVFGDILGNMYFAAIGSTGNSTQNLSDVSLFSKVNIKLKTNGSVQIGQAAPIGTHANALLHVSGKIACQSLYVLKASSWADYVFKQNNLEKLDEVEKYIKLNKHLPGVPSEQDVNEHGYDINTMDGILLGKIETLYLHIIELEKEIKQLKSK